jgi:hypothetical protein
MSDTPELTMPMNESALLAPSAGTLTPRPWRPAIDDLLAIRSLEDDWDGQGSPAPHPAIVDAALWFAQSIEESGFPSPDFAVAGVNGTVIFEWHLATGYLEIEVVSPDTAERRWLRSGSDVAESSVLTRPS